MCTKRLAHPIQVYFNNFQILYVLITTDFTSSPYIKVSLYKSIVKTWAISIMLENVTLTHQAPVTGSASFPLIMNNGNRMENTHPL